MFTEEQKNDTICFEKVASVSREIFTLGLMSHFVSSLTCLKVQSKGGFELIKYCIGPIYQLILVWLFV